MKTKLDLIECINLIESVNIKLSEIFSVNLWRNILFLLAFKNIFQNIGLPEISLGAGNGTYDNNQAWWQIGVLSLLDINLKHSL